MKLHSKLAVKVNAANLECNFILNCQTVGRVQLLSPIDHICFSRSKWYIYGCDFRYNRYNKEEPDIVHYGGGDCSSSDSNDFINDDPEESDYDTSQDDDSSAAASVPASERASSANSSQSGSQATKDSEGSSSSGEDSPKPSSSGLKRRNTDFALLSSSDFESLEDAPKQAVTPKRKVLQKHGSTSKKRNSKVTN